MTIPHPTAKAIGVSCRKSDEGYRYKNNNTSIEWVHDYSTRPLLYTPDFWMPLPKINMQALWWKYAYDI